MNDDDDDDDDHKNREMNLKRIFSYRYKNILDLDKVPKKCLENT